ncbi:hypothetical protein Dimus_004839 [Dionaea muscipula]
MVSSPFFFLFLVQKNVELVLVFSTKVNVMSSVDNPCLFLWFVLDGFMGSYVSLWTRSAYGSIGAKPNGLLKSAAKPTTNVRLWTSIRKLSSAFNIIGRFCHS